MTKYCIIRILGNDLPPRHNKKQTLINLKFIFENEEDFSDCKKIYILNRIIDPVAEQELIDLLNENKVEFIRIPFELGNYDSTWNNGTKMQEIIQLNKARNKGIEEGMKYAEWVFPLDGNIFVTSEAWKNITTHLNNTSETFFKLAMYRLKKNHEVFDFISDDYDKQEEQIILSKNSDVRFDESLGYGYMNKMKLLEKFPDAICLEYSLRLCDYSFGFVNKKRYADRKMAIKNLIARIESDFLGINKTENPLQKP